MFYLFQFSGSPPLFLPGGYPSSGAHGVSGEGPLGIPVATEKIEYFWILGV